MPGRTEPPSLDAKAERSDRPPGHPAILESGVRLDRAPGATVPRPQGTTPLERAQGTTPLERAQGTTLWRQIEQSVERDIHEGRHGPGARLPTEAELAQRFDVNRHTVRRAMEELARRGLIRIEQGRGSFVAEDLVDYTIGPRTRFSEVVARQNREPGGITLRALEVPADEEVALGLHLRPRRPVVLIERLGLVDGLPVSIATHYFCAARFPGLLEAYRQLGGVTAALKACGVADYLRRSTRVTARLPTADESALLKLPRTRPVLVTEATNVDLAGSIVEFGIACYSTARVQLVFEP